MIDQIHQQFITVVKEGRGKRLKETPEIFSGLFWNGEKAVELGLADKLGNLDYVAREVIKAEDVIDYTPKENVAERLGEAARRVDGRRRGARFEKHDRDSLAGSDQAAGGMRSTCPG